MDTGVLRVSFQPHVTINYSIGICMKRVMLQAQQCLGWILIDLFIYFNRDLEN